tara:strand:+ start:749 stop:985 length:237 start_codon:yes stop_codon:yes gene_type:complete
MESSPPLYKIGDFVRCKYDFYDFYTYLYGEDEYVHLPFYGIIVDLAWDDGWYDMEVVYKVYCMDGVERFFLEDELSLP